MHPLQSVNTARCRKFDIHSEVVSGFQAPLLTHEDGCFYASWSDYASSAAKSHLWRIDKRVFTTQFAISYTQTNVFVPENLLLWIRHKAF